MRRRVSRQQRFQLSKVFTALVLSLYLVHVEARIQAGLIAEEVIHRDLLAPRSLERDEYPVPLEPFHLVYNHHQNRNQTLKEMEEMNLLSTTRKYISQTLQQYRPDDFIRVVLYLFVRDDDKSKTTVAYSGRTFFGNPTPMSMVKEVQNTTWLSFLGHNQTIYLTRLKDAGILGIDSVTLMNVGGDIIDVQNMTGNLIATDSMPDMAMGSGVSMTIYLCAIIVPVIVFALLAIGWLARKLRFDVDWDRSRHADPDNEIWQSRGAFENDSLPQSVTAMDESDRRSAILRTDCNGFETNELALHEENGSVQLDRSKQKLALVMPLREGCRKDPRSKKKESFRKMTPSTLITGRKKKMDNADRKRKLEIMDVPSSNRTRFP